MPTEMKMISEIFTNPSVTQDMVAQAGEKMFLAIYQAASSERDLNRLR